ncbi:MAG: NADH-quinone oxidoreductase subunit N [Gemmataceae bacterium]
MILDSEQFSSLLSHLGDDSFRFVPEIILCLTIVSMLVLRTVLGSRSLHASSLGIIACLAGVASLVALWSGLQVSHQGIPAFDGLLQIDTLSTFLRTLILAAALLVLLLGRMTGLPDREDSADFNVLLLGATLGMMLMVSANHLLMVFLALEMASLPSYVLAGFLKGRPKASEAALKYVIFGAASSGIMLFGISLIVGQFGTGNLRTLAHEMAQVAHNGGLSISLMAGMLFTFFGLAYKLSAVPAHFWLPDAFEGAAAEVAGFLSVASKTAAVGLTARILLTLQDWAVSSNLDLSQWPRTIGIALMIVAGVTATVGNLAALPQTNLKRLFGYSTIAHAGYLIMALSTMSHSGIASTLVYLVAYLFMNLGAFSMVALIRNRTGSEELSAAAGLMKRSPWLGVCFAIFLFSLLGVPPLAGFAGKFLIFSSVYEAGRTYAEQDPTLGLAYPILLGFGVANTAISAGYYLPGHESHEPGRSQG